MSGGIALNGTRKIKRELKLIKQALPFVLPGLLLVCIFVIYPVFRNIMISLSDYKLVTGDMTYVGLKNYHDLMTGYQGRFWFAYRNTLLYAVVTTPVTLFIGLMFAVMINSLNKGSVFFRTVYYLPVITSWIIIGLVFKYLFNVGSSGPVNYILVDVLHVMKEHINWLKLEWQGNLVIWLLGIWKGIGFPMIIFMAALQSIPRDIYQVAALEGSSPVNTFFKITIPLLKPATYFLIVQSLIGSYNVFLQVLVLTNGDPSGRTSVLQYLLYDQTFKNMLFGQGAAIGVITALSVFLLTIVLGKLLKSENYI
jgi:ABC-type sugar transport systems, permease components